MSVRVLLTGSAGFIGAAVDRALVAGGCEVVRVDALLPESHGTGAAVPHPDTHVLDVRDAEQWRDLLRGVDVVCHQAAVVGAGTSVTDLPLYAAHNDLGTAALLAAMTGAGVARLVLASSMVVYGEGGYACPAHGQQTPAARRRTDLEAGDFEVHCSDCRGALDWVAVQESAALDPRTGYAASKVAQEHFAAAWARQADGAVVALRYHNVYGPGMPRDTPYSGVAAMFRSSLERGEPAQVYEDGQQLRDFVHVEDVARANLAAVGVAGEAAPGGFLPVNVASGRPIRIGEVAELVTAGSGGGPAPEVTGRYRLGDVRHVVASPERAAAELGFRATVPPEAGLERFAREPLRG